MERHWNVVAESIIVGDIDQEVHDDENEPGGEGNLWRHSSKVGGKHKTLNTDQKKLSKSYKVANTGIFADKKFKKDNIGTASKDCDYHS